MLGTEGFSRMLNTLTGTAQEYISNLQSQVA